MKINWKLRYLNKTTLVALVTTTVAFIYQLLGIFGVVSPISQDTVTTLMMTIINILAVLGIVIDPTTKGISDSVRAQGYKELG